MREIFDRQWRLNIHTLANIGKDFEKTIADPEQKVIWIENYRKALSAELAELIREVEEYGIGTANGKIEIVDILHFLVSLSHIVDVKPEDVPAFSMENGVSFESCAIRLFLGLDALQNSLKWKWWAKGGGFKADKARDAVLDLWKSLTLTSAVFSLEFDGAQKDLYRKEQGKLPASRSELQRRYQDGSRQPLHQDLKGFAAGSRSYKEPWYGRGWIEGSRGRMPLLQGLAGGARRWEKYRPANAGNEG